MIIKRYDFPQNRGRVETPGGEYCLASEVEKMCYVNNIARLDIAVRVMAGFAASLVRWDTDPPDVAFVALSWADALIAAAKKTRT